MTYLSPAFSQCNVSGSNSPISLGINIPNATIDTSALSVHKVCLGTPVFVHTESADTCSTIIYSGGTISVQFNPSTFQFQQVTSISGCSAGISSLTANIVQTYGTSLYYSGSEQNAYITFPDTGLYAFTCSGFLEDCDADTTLNLIAINTFFIRVFAHPMANAGNDTIDCGISTNNPNWPFYILLNAGNLQTGQSGTWSFLTSGFSPGSVNIVSPNTDTTSVYLAPGVDGPLQFIWTVTDNSFFCPFTDTVTILVHGAEPATIYPNTLTVCGNTVMYAVNQPGLYDMSNPGFNSVAGSSANPGWTVIQTGGPDTANILYYYQNQIISNFAIIVDSAGTYTFEYTINSPCTYTTSPPFTITFQNPTFNNNTPNQWFSNCALNDTLFFLLDADPLTDSLYFSAFTNPVVDAYADSDMDTIFIVLDDPNLTSTYQFHYHVVDTAATNCHSWGIITLYPHQPFSLNVTDTVIELPCGTPHYNFDSHMSWEHPAGTNASPSRVLFEKPVGSLAYLQPNCYHCITNMDLPGSYSIAFTLIHCGDTLRDTLRIIRNGTPNVANAGTDIYPLCGQTQVTLNGNSPIWGTGEWTIENVPDDFDLLNPFLSDIEEFYFSFNSSTSLNVPDLNLSGFIYPGVYEFKYEITDNIYGCGSFINYVNVYVADPAADSSSAGTDTLVCDSASIWLNAFITGTITAGSWQALDGMNPGPVTIAEPFSSSTQVHVQAEGTYYFTWMLAGSCNGPDTVQVTYNPNSCCFAYNNPAFQQILNDTVFNNQTVLSGKYFVKGIITINGSIDITNVDMVFDECAGMIFNDTAQLRANNSVFRPCEYNKTWLGFYYHSSVSSIIENCIFKNAQCAIRAEAEEPKLRLSRNTFINNWVALYMNNYAVSSEAIIGNNFSFDTGMDSIFPGNCDTVLLSSSPVGIWLMGCSVQGAISQNEFIGSSDKDTVFHFYTGILNSGGNYAYISDNRFTNCYRSLDSQGGIVYFTNNRIDHNQAKFNNLNMGGCGIFVSTDEYAKISHNTFFRISGNDNPNNNVSAIWLEGYGIICHANDIRGFHRGINAEKLVVSVINENTIKDADDAGIFMHDVQGIISCNEIDMLNEKENNGVGIYWSAQNDIYARGSMIKSNCITNSKIALLLIGTDPDTVFAEDMVTNNFLYSYRDAGIATAGVNLTMDDAANTLLSNNNANVTADLFALDMPFLSDANFGIQSTGGTGIVTVTDDNLMHSTAACAKQVSDPEDVLNPLNENELMGIKRVCLENYDSLLTDFIIDTLLPGSALREGAHGILNDNNEETLILNIRSIIARVSSAHRTELLENTYSDIKSNVFLTERAQAELDFIYGYTSYNKVTCVQGLNALNGKIADDDYFIYSLTYKQRFVRNIVSPTDLDRLQNMAGNGHSHAGFLLHAFTGQHPQLLQEKYINKPKVWVNQKLNDPYLFEIIPNPNDGVFSAYYHNIKDPLNSIVVYNTMGIPIQNISVNISKGYIEIDLKQYAKGLYYIHGLTEKGETFSTKSIKY